MKFKAMLSTLLISSFVLSSVPAMSLEASSRDLQLMSALENISNRGLVSMTQKQWDSVGYKLNAGILSAVGLTVGVVLTKVLTLSPRSVANLAQEFGKSPAKIRMIQQSVRGYAPVVAVAFLGATVINTILANRSAQADHDDAEMHRRIAFQSPKVYRGEMAHFLALSLPEQFLSAKQDPAFTDDLILLAESLDAADAAKSAARAKWFSFSK